MKFHIEYGNTITGRGEEGAETIFKELMLKYFQNLTDIKRITEIIIPRHVIIKLMKARDEYKVI